MEMFRLLNLPHKKFRLRTKQKLGPVFCCCGGGGEVRKRTPPFGIYILSPVALKREVERARAFAMTLTFGSGLEETHGNPACFFWVGLGRLGGVLADPDNFENATFSSPPPRGGVCGGD